MKVTITHPVLKNELETSKWLVVEKNSNVAVAALGNRASAREVARVRGDGCKVIAISDAEIEFNIQETKGAPAKVNKSTTVKPCKKVWEIADANKGMRRKDILALCVEKGIAYYTARTQYQHWFEIQKEMKEREANQKG